jgi:NTP pyrophosphatase (non-canonical NTP hydrolase)
MSPPETSPDPEVDRRLARAAETALSLSLAPMDADEYDRYVQSRLDPKVAIRGHLAIRRYAAAKAAGEAGEILEHETKAEFHEAEIDQNEVIKEWGDLLFQVSLGAQANGLSLRMLMALNRQKLDRRGDYAAWLTAKNTT